MVAFESLVDLIYEAAVLPELWPKVLDRVGQAYGAAKGGVLFGGAAPDFQMIGGGAAAEILPEFIALGWAAQNDRVPRTMARRHAGFISDFHTEEEIASLPIYTQFLTPRGFDAPAATWAPGLMGDDLAVSFEGFADRAAAAAALPDLDRIRPHLARAMALSAKIGLEKVRAAVTALGDLGAPAACLASRGRLLAANSLFERELGVRIFDTRGRLRIGDPAAAMQLRDVLERIEAGEPAGQSIALRSQGELPGAVMHVLPFRGAGRDVFTGAVAMLAITWGKSRLSLGEGVLEALFDLTPAEARLSTALAEGEPLLVVSRVLGISSQTARVHLRNIYGKMGISRQVDLVSLLRDLALPVDAEGGVRVALTRPQ